MDKCTNKIMSNGIVVEWYSPPNPIFLQTPGICECDVTWKNSLCRPFVIKDLGMRSSWIIPVGPISDGKCPYVRYTKERH